MANTEGIDISGAQRGCVDWAKLDPAIRFVVVKLTEGVSYEDGAARDHCAGVRTAGRDLAGYHYLRVRAGKSQDARQQAHDAAAVATRERCEWLGLDVESEGNAGARPVEYATAVMDFAHEWRSIVETPLVLYTYPGLWGSLGAMPMELAELPLWIAHYAPPSPKVPIVPAPWSEWFLWQYAASASVIGRVDGVRGMVDRNVFRGSRDEMRARLGLRVAPLPNLADDPRVKAQKEGD